jgi:hypothetical protein
VRYVGLLPVPGPFDDFLLVLRLAVREQEFLRFVVAAELAVGPKDFRFEG